MFWIAQENALLDFDEVNISAKDLVDILIFKYESDEFIYFHTKAQAQKFIGSLN